jgi:RNA polymerase sigma-70 factor, ECF subfamily
VRRPTDPLSPTASQSERPSAGDRLVALWRSAESKEERDECFRQIYLFFYRTILRYFIRRGFPDDEAKDLVQDTFLRVHEKLDSFRGDSSFESWLFRVAENIYKNRLRTLAAQKRAAKEVAWEDVTDGDLIDAPTDDFRLRTADDGPLDQVLTEERIDHLRQAMTKLPPQMQRCVLLRVVGDLKYREIAAILQVSVDTVKAHLYQARQQLKGMLGDYFTDLRP